ncbi:MAG: hypothetical protein C4539_09555 [Ignavibacteriales bacterium]|nr:MAG: hypothetical protein C4539_09555 [Ignavibacteriales bacterium]
MNYQIFIRKYYLLTILLLIIFYQGCTFEKPNKNNGFIQSSTGLKYKVLKEGRGEPVKVGQEILIHEKMLYMNDSLLFNSRNLPHPVKVLIGGNQVIKGIDEALPGMKKGEIKKLIIPPHLSKRIGTQTFPHPDSTLVYEIELIEILN